MAGKQEVEIKFRVQDLRALSRRLRQAGFRVKTRRTHEMNILLDDADHALSRRGEVLRIRHYGKVWTLTHKSRGQTARHKIRTETETEVVDGEALAAVFFSLGYTPRFRYEKYRTEWSDGRGHVVLDETPIGDFAEIEGTAEWIDRTARRLGVDHAEYLTSSYTALFFHWRAATGSMAAEMTWKALKRRPPRR